MRRKRRRPAQKFNRKMRTKLMVLFSLILAVLCGLVGRLTYIEHTKGETYQKKVLSMQSYDSKTIPYQRGEIIDRSGTVLATSVAVYNVILDCTVVNDKEEYVDPTVEALVKCFPELDETEIRKIIKEKKDKRYIVLAKKVPYDEVQPFVELQDAVEEVESCSACYGYLIPALDRLREEGLLPELHEKICIGQGYRGKSGALGVGSCTSGFKYNLKGCPPTDEQMYEFLKQYIATRRKTEAEK